MNNDRSEDDIETRMITKQKWLAPVAAVDALPKEGVEDGTMCFVEPADGTEDQVWQFKGRLWFRVD